MFFIVQACKLFFQSLIKSHTFSHIPISTRHPFLVFSHGQLMHKGTIFCYFQNCVIQAVSRNGSMIYIHYIPCQYCMQWIIDLLVLSWYVTFRWSSILIAIICGEISISSIMCYIVETEQH